MMHTRLATSNNFRPNFPAFSKNSVRFGMFGFRAGVTRTWDSTLVKSPEDKAGLKLAFRWTADFSTDFHQQVVLYTLTWGRKVKLVLDENADVVLTHHFVGGFWMTYWEYKNKPFTNYDFLGQKLVHFSIKPRSCVLCIFIPQFGKCESE